MNSYSYDEIIEKRAALDEITNLLKVHVESAKARGYIVTVATDRGIFKFDEKSWLGLTKIN